MQIKRAIASSIYPKKLVFDGKGFRTDEISSITKYIFIIISTLANKKADIELLKILMPVK
jgi:hypothetical protein